MKNDYAELEQIKNVLQTVPRGLTILEISQKLGFSRNSTAKYLEMLLMAGKVKFCKFGRSKIYTLSDKIAAATVLSLSSDLIVFIDDGLKIVEVNDKFLRFTGLSRAQIVGYTLEEINVDLLLHRDILLNVKDGLSGREVTREIRVEKGPEEFHFKVKLLPIETDNCRTQIALVFEDITVRKKAEIALKGSEARYRAVVEDQTELICRMRPDTTITFVNEAWCRFFKVNRESFLGKKIGDLVSFACLADHRHVLTEIKVKKPTVTIEIDMHWQGGQILWLESTCRGIFDGTGRLQELQIVARDITVHKQAELDLKRSEARYHAIVDSQLDVVSLHAPDSTITFVNKACEQFWGLPEEDLIGTKLSDLLSPPDYGRVWDRIAQIKPRCEHLPFEDIEIIVRGSKCWFQWSCTGIFDDRGALIEYLIVAHDITERKRAEVAAMEGREMMMAVFYQSPNALSLVLPDFRCSHANRAFCSLTGYSEQELISGAAGDLMGISEDVEADSIQCLLDGRTDHYTVVKGCLRKDGSTLNLRKQVWLVRDMAGNPQHFFCMFTETAENQLAE